MKTTKVKTTIKQVLVCEIAMIPAIILSVIDAFRMAWWDVFDLEGYTGYEVLDLYFSIAGEYMVSSILILACMAGVIAIVAVVLALRKDK